MMITNKASFAAFKIKEFKWYLLLRLGIVLGWSMQFVLIEWEVYRITKDPLSLGLIGLMEIIPAITMALFAGHIVDQSEKKQLLQKCLLALLTISITMTALLYPNIYYTFSNNFIVKSLYILVFIGGIVRAFIIPSSFSLLGLIINNNYKVNASAWSSSVWQVASVIGPAIAGFSIAYLDIHGAMILVTISIVVALLGLSKITKKPIINPKIGEPIFTSLKEGIAFVFKNKTIRNALSIDMFAVLFGGAVALLPIFAQDILKVGSQGFGILRAAPAVGSLLTMIIATAIPLHNNAGKKLLLAVFGFGICMIVFALSTNFWISVIALFLSGATDGISVVIRQTILQIYTPDHMRGRVASVNSIFVGSSNELGAFESGVTAKLMGGVVPAVVFGGIMTLLVVVTTAIVAPNFKNLNLEPDN